MNPPFNTLKNKGNNHEKKNQEHCTRTTNQRLNAGTVSEGEFFAVVTEVFFEQPKQLEKKHPELFNELKKFYHLNPLEWG